MLQRLHNQRNDLLARISGLTDEVLQEQCAEEYNDLEKTIADAERQHQQDEIKQAAERHIRYYNRMFQDAQLIEALEKTNEMSIEPLIKQHRIRQPQLHDRRSLLLLSQILKKNIKIRNMEYEEIDIIGREEESINLIVNITRVSQFDESAKPVILRGD